ncbi:MAG: NUDIX domain-containing protein, partial [Longimicrobiales bacterium]
RGTETKRPAAKERSAVPEVDIAVVVAAAHVAGRPRLFLRKRPGRGLLAGMWEFPGVEIGIERDARLTASELAGELGLPVRADGRKRESVGGLARAAPNTRGDGVCSSEALIPLETVTHTFTHLKARYRSFLLRIPATGNPSSQGRWLSLEEIEKVPLPVAQGRILQLALHRMNRMGDPT